MMLMIHGTSLIWIKTEHFMIRLRILRIRSQLSINCKLLLEFTSS